jgi:hypothetical protein
MDKLDSESDSISRASGIHCRATETFALYFSNGRISSVVESSPHFISRTGTTCKHVVGIYKSNVDFKLIMEDIRFFYAEANKIKNDAYKHLVQKRDRQNAKELLVD